MTEVYRLVREKFARPLSGAGSAIKGGRWNSAGIELIYTAENRSLAMAEVAVHLTFATLPADYVMMVIALPSSVSIGDLDRKRLEKDWNSFPYTRSTQLIGDRFVTEARSCALRVPSAVTPGDDNILINPHHREFSKVKIKSIVPFRFDRRLFK